MEDFQRREKLLLEILDCREEKEHFHQDIELIYVLAGCMEVNMDGHKIKMAEGDVLIINANKRHYLKSYGQVLYARLMILYELVSDILNNFDLTFICNSAENTDPAYEGLCRLMQQLLGHFLSNKGKKADFAYISLCYQILDYICTHFLIRSASETGDSESDKYRQRLHQIENYIRANYRSAISLKELAEKLYLSNGYLSRFFKKNYGMSFAEYLTNVRLHHAVDQLLYTDIPITRIVYDNGFASVAIFNKAFKKEYGETPSAVRKRAAKNDSPRETELTEDLAHKLENVLWNEFQNGGEENGDTDCVEISALSSRPLKRIWNRIINIGSAEDLLRSEVQEHVFLLRESLKFEYVRFWNPFSKELLIDINNPEHKYNFSRLDSILDFLLKHDIRPFIELENKPKRVEKTTTSSLIYEVIESVNTLDNWCALVEAFVRHIVSRYGRDEVDRWRFELWLDADKLSDELQLLYYFQKMKAAREIIHRYSDAKIGGCGMHGYVKGTEKKSSYIRAFHKKAKDSDAVPDFITMYSYAYDIADENGVTVSKPSQDFDFMKHVIDNYKRDTGNELEDRGICLTEWNLTISDRNLINDSCFKGAYVMKNYIEMVDSVDAMAYFRGTDRVSESYDTDAFLFGGTGLLTRDGVQKPVMFALHFLNRLYPQYVGKGTNYLVTKDGHDNYGIVCHNCRKLSYNYFLCEEDKLDRDHLSKYFEDLDDLTLELALGDVRDGLYQAKLYRINDQNGSVQRIWKEMEYETNLSREDIRYIQRSCEPKLSMQKIHTKDGVVRVRLTMMANEIAYISLRYLEKE